MDTQTLLLSALVTGLVSIVTSVITAIVTTRLSMRQEEEKWERDLQKLITELKVEKPSQANAILAQFSKSYLLTKGDNERKRHFIPSSGRSFIGRDKDCEIPISDSHISGRHVMLESKNDDVFLVDLGGHSGTIVNGESVKANERIKLSDGEIIQIGSTKLSFHSLK